MNTTIDLAADLASKQPSVLGSDVSSEFYSTGRDELARVSPLIGSATGNASRIAQGEVSPEMTNSRAREDILVLGTPTSELVSRVAPMSMGAATTPLQLWEGEIIAIDSERQQCRVKLVAKLGNVSDHIGTISMNWISDQDRNLVKPGAIFYLTLYREVKRGGTISNAQELRFRRLPSWTLSQLKAMRAEVDCLRSRLVLKNSSS